ncbi:MAG TPA: helix-turn-helix domain-containing GNAT family N-acetyltransferase [Longimicrobiales bacterium]|nr:helix-turn-helix domain-containing GNAT family N-acetyltransferase [Longimicrobiales bacterium]
MGEPVLEQRIEAVRRFNRFYTRQIGVLQEHLLQSPISLTEARVLYELAGRAEITATELGATLGVDAGYLSRLLGSLRERGLLARSRSMADGRQSLLRLTARGQQAFARLNTASAAEIGDLLAAHTEEDQRRLVAALEVVERLLDGRYETQVPYVLRPPRAGDYGWIIHRHGVLYAQEYGWDERFEALVAEIIARFVQNFDARRERCWIAERDGQSVGCVFVVAKSKTIAQLRLLLVEPSARGLGIGRRLVDECIRFARLKGYRKLTLWTNDVLHAARHIYEQAGFQLVREQPHRDFGTNLVGQTWDLPL